MKIIKLKTKEDVTNELAKMLLEQISNKPDSVLGLATGSTPTTAYHELVKDYLIHQTDYSKVTTFNLDEYIGLDPKDKNSYRSFMNENLFNYINIKKENTFLPRTAKTGDKDYSYYDKLIEEHGGIDLQVLGIGENGHIAFNEPGTPGDSLTHKVKLAENTRENNSVFFESIDDVPTEAVTMGIASILKAKKIVMAITKSNKAEIVKRLFSEEPSESLPASFLMKHENVVVLIDEDAAQLMEDLK